MLNGKMLKKGPVTIQRTTDISPPFGTDKSVPYELPLQIPIRLFAFLFLVSHPPQDMELNGHGAEEGDGIGGGLGQLNAGEAH